MEVVEENNYENEIQSFFDNENIDALKLLMKEKELPKECFKININNFSSYKMMRFILDNLVELDNFDVEHFYNISKQGFTQSNKKYLNDKGIYYRYQRELYELAYKNNDLKYFITLQTYGLKPDIYLFLKQICSEFEITNKKIIDFMLENYSFDINEFIDNEWEDIDINFLKYVVLKKNLGFNNTDFFNKAIFQKKWKIANLFLKEDTNIKKFTDKEFNGFLKELTRPIEYGDDLTEFGSMIIFMNKIAKCGFDIKGKSKKIFELVLKKAPELIGDFMKYNVDLDYSVDNHWLLKNMMLKNGPDSYYVKKLIQKENINLNYIV